MSSWWVRSQHPGAATGGHASRSNGYLEPSLKLRELLKTNSWHMKYPSNLAYSQGKMFVSGRVIKSWGWKKGISPLTHGASASWWDVFSRSVIPKNRTWRNHSLEAMTSQHICHICFIFVSIYKSIYVYLCYYNIWCIIFSWFYKQSMWNLGIYRNEPRISPSKPPKKTSPLDGLHRVNTFVSFACHSLQRFFFELRHALQKVIEGHGSTGGWMDGWEAKRGIFSS